MALDYTTLVGAKSVVGSIKSWVNYELLDVEGILADAQAYISGAMRVREMRASATLPIGLGATSVALPTGFLDPVKYAYVDGWGTLQPVPWEQYLDIVSKKADGTFNPGRPSAYAIFDEKLNFEVASDAAYTPTLLFFKSPTLLSGAAPTNFLCTRYPNILRRACLMYAADMAQDDPEFAKWQQGTDSLIARANIENDFVNRGADYSVSVR